jgi:putative phosphoesterase
LNILVISDSHGDALRVEQLLNLYAKYVQAAVHLGDVTADLTPFAKYYPGLQMHTVPGNCDGDIKAEQEKIIAVNGSRILLAHGHRHNVKMNYDRIAYYAEEKDVSACFFGHTHQPEEFVRGPVYFFNPGSLGRPVFGARPSYGLVGVSDAGVVKGKILEL